VNNKIPFLITIDTEGDNLWSYNGKDRITTKNAGYLYRFQNLCDKYLFKPTWLVNYEMANCNKFVKFGRSVLEKDAGEIGMHLHAWNSPPIKPLGKDDNESRSYLIEFSLDVMEEKINFLTTLLKDKFNTEIVSHRAGRWALNESYSKLLIKYGYKIDCSVTPYVNWENMKGGKLDSQGSDYTGFNTQEYFINENNIIESGSSGLLEVPMSILPTFSYKYKNIIQAFPKIVQKIINKFCPFTIWLRPNGRNLNDMKFILDNASKNNLNYVEFMIHSSEFMSGGSPYFKDQKSIDKLYEDLEELMAYAKNNGFIGMTMGEFYNEYIGN
jgi:hypothetical protein